MVNEASEHSLAVLVFSLSLSLCLMQPLLQRDAMDCGPTCLAIVAQHYKVQVSRQKLRELDTVPKTCVNSKVLIFVVQ